MVLIYFSITTSSWEFRKYRITCYSHLGIRFTCNTAFFYKYVQLGVDDTALIDNYRGPWKEDEVKSRNTEKYPKWSARLLELHVVCVPNACLGLHFTRALVLYVHQITKKETTIPAIVNRILRSICRISHFVLKTFTQKEHQQTA